MLIGDRRQADRQLITTTKKMNTTTEQNEQNGNGAEGKPKSKAAQLLGRIKTWLAGLSFRTGVIVTAMCIPFYFLSFAQTALPWFSTATKGVLWAVLFGLAKTCQYGGLTILGKEGVVRMKAWFKKKKQEEGE